MTGPAPNLVVSHDLGDLTFDEAFARCRYRSVCGPRAIQEGEEITIEGCVTLLGPPSRLPQPLVERLAADVAGGRTFMVAAEHEASLRQVLSVVDQLALLVSPVAGRA